MKYKYINTVTAPKQAPAYFLTPQGVFAKGTQQYDTEAIAQGYKEFIDTPQPEQVNGYEWKKTYVNGDCITVEWIKIEVPVPEPIVPVYSKLKIRDQLKACTIIVNGMSAKEMFRAILEQQDLMDEWDDMVFLAGDEPRVMNIVSNVEVIAILEQYGLDIMTVLKNAEDETFRYLYKPYIPEITEAENTVS